MNSTGTKLRFTILILSILPGATSHCATTPIQAFLEKQAPGYRSLEPVSSKDPRGTHLVETSAMTPATNRCFRGELDQQAYSSFSEYTQTYSGGFEAGTELARDFGGALGASVSAGAGRTFNGTIAMGKIEEFRMNNVYFDPSSVCAQTDEALAEIRSGDATFTVLTRALKAGTIGASSTDGSHISLSLAVTEFGGRLDQSAQDTQSWKGVQIFFAALPQEYRVGVNQIQQEVGQGQEIKLGRCSASIQAYSPVQKRWNGSINCEGGENFPIRRQAVREWTGAGLPQGGVSYSVKFTPVQHKVGVFAAHLIQWTALEIDG